MSSCQSIQFISHMITAIQPQRNNRSNHHWWNRGLYRWEGRWCGICLAPVALVSSCLIILLSQWYHSKSRYAPLHFRRLFVAVICSWAVLDVLSCKNDNNMFIYLRMCKLLYSVLKFEDLPIVRLQKRTKADRVPQNSGSRFQPYNRPASQTSNEWQVCSQRALHV